MGPATPHDDRSSGVIGEHRSVRCVQALAIAVELAGKAVRDYAAEHPSCEGMGTTCTVGAVRGSHMVIAHGGDSKSRFGRTLVEADAVHGRKEGDYAAQAAGRLNVVGGALS